jgi:AcrR family transcriptional regulator
MTGAGRTVKSRREEYKERTRTAVLDAAGRQFAQRGFAAATIDDVAHAARVSKGTVYYHFADKAELFEAVFRHRQSRLVGAVITAVEAQGGGAWQQLQAGLDAYLDGTIGDAAHRALLREAPGALGIERCRQIDEEMGLPILRAALQSLVAAGEIVDQPIEMLSRVLFSALCEAAMTAGADRDPGSARQQAAAVLTAFTSGLRRTQ